MSLRIYNTLRRALEVFQPLQPGHVRMYVCGMTVYDLCHLGHARSMVAFDVVQRWLRVSGYEVTYVRNITDIDDKIIQRAVKNNETVRSLTDRMIAALHQDADALGIERPTHEPRATDYVPQMLSMIGTLRNKGLAYQAPGGDVLFAVRQFADYGKLSGKTLDELNAGERVAVQDGKRDPLDFVLWKSAKPQEPDEVKWPSPFRRRPPRLAHSSALPWAAPCWARVLTSTAVARIWRFRTMKTKSPKAKAQPVSRLPIPGCTTALSTSITRRCPNPWATSSPFAMCCKRTSLKSCAFSSCAAITRSPLNYSNVHLDDARSALKRLYTALSVVVPHSASGHRLDESLMPPASKRPWMKTLVPQRPLPCCLSWPRKSIASQSAHLAGLLQALGGCLGLSAGRSTNFFASGRCPCRCHSD